MYVQELTVYAGHVRFAGGAVPGAVGWVYRARHGPSDICSVMTKVIWFPGRSAAEDAARAVHTLFIHRVSGTRCRPAQDSSRPCPPFAVPLLFTLDELSVTLGGILTRQLKDVSG